jgi:hypothetical protein
MREAAQELIGLDPRIEPRRRALSNTMWLAAGLVLTINNHMVMVMPRHLRRLMESKLVYIVINH